MTFDSLLPGAAAGAVAGLLAAALLAKRFFRAKRSPASPAVPDASAQLAKDVDDMVQQLDLLTKQIETRIDSRLTQLDQAMAQLDKKMTECDDKTRSMEQTARDLAKAAQESAIHAMAEQEAVGMPIWTPPANANDAEPPCHYVAEPLPAAAAPFADDAPQAAQDDNAVTLPGSWPVPEHVSPAPQQKPLYDASAGEALQGNRHKEILRLAREGCDGVAIARQLQMPPGEVELILNLHRVGQKLNT